MIRDKVQSKVAKAFDTKLIDATTKFTCTKIISSGSYNPVTEEYENSITKEYSGRGVFGSYLKDLVKPSDYQAEDVKAIVLQNELILESVQHKPEIGDEWQSEKGDFKIITLSPDPTDSIWVVQLRKVSA